MFGMLDFHLVGTWIIIGSMPPVTGRRLGRILVLVAIGIGGRIVRGVTGRGIRGVFRIAEHVLGGLARRAKHHLTKTSDRGILVPHDLEEPGIRFKDGTHQLRVFVTKRIGRSPFEDVIKLLRSHFDNLRRFPRHDSTGFPCHACDPSNANGA